MCFLIILLLSESVPRTREALLSIFNMEKTKSFKLSRFEKVGYVARRYDKVKMTSSVSGYIAQRNSIVKMTPPVSGYIAQRNDTVRNTFSKRDNLKDLVFSILKIDNSASLVRGTLSDNNNMIRKHMAM
jgi:hypothetical protein